MFSITVFHGLRYMTYQSDIIPMKDDIYPGNYLFDEYQYVVKGRILNTKAESIVINVEYSYPELVTKKELTEAEADLLTQEHLS
jgi:hypothetical protein